MVRSRRLSALSSVCSFCTHVSWVEIDVVVLLVDQMVLLLRFRPEFGLIFSSFGVSCSHATLETCFGDDWGGLITFIRLRSFKYVFPYWKFQHALDATLSTFSCNFLTWVQDPWVKKERLGAPCASLFEHIWAVLPLVDCCQVTANAPPCAYMICIHIQQPQNDLLFKKKHVTQV